MRVKGLKEQRIAIIYIQTDIKLFTYNSADVQACYLAKKANNIESSWITSEIHCEIISLLVV